MQMSAGQNYQAIIQLAQVAIAAEQMGGAQQTLDMAVDYTQEREQFGRKIAELSGNQTQGLPI